MKIKEYLKFDWLLLVIILIPFIIIPLVWNSLPEQIPMHWNFEGMVDNWAPRFPGIFYLPLFNIALYILFLVIPKLDPRKRNYSLFMGAYKAIRLIMAAFMLYMFLIITFASIGYELNIMMLVINGILVLFLVLGNLMGKLRSNYFVGFRMPWTLEYQEIWAKTHRFAGKVWVFGTLLMFPLEFILSDTALTVTFFVYIALLTLIPAVYSYGLYLSIKKNLTEKI